MRILLQEMKKIFHPVMLLICVLINVLMYYIFIEFDISYFPNGRPATDVYRIGIEMVEKYGHELDEQEYEDFKQVYKEEVKKADQYIQQNDEWAEVGITTYQEFRDMDFGVNPALDEVRDKLIFEQGIDLFWEIPEREHIIEEMKFLEERYGYSYLAGTPTKQQDERIKEVVNSGTVYSIFPAYPVEDNFFSISKSIMITILVSILFMVSPIFLRDFKNNMVSLQYTTKTGRAIFKWEIVAGLVSSFLITTVLVVVYYGIYFTNDIGMFLKSGVNTFMGSTYWYDFTFLQLILLTIGLTYVLALFLSLIAIFTSSICRNYIAIIGILLPIFVLICMLINRGVLLGDAFLIYHSQIFFAFLYSVIVLVPIIVIIWKWKREKVVDIFH